MANARQSNTKRLNMAERAQQQLEIHFPGIDPRMMWSRKNNDGFTTVPRTLPIVMQAVDEASKGIAPGHVLLCLWARAPDNPLVAIENQATFAAEAGFNGPRAVDTWRKRMKRLRELGVIQAKRGASGEFHYILLLNPNTALEAMHKDGKVQDVLYGRLVDRLAEVGAISEIHGIRELWGEIEAEKLAEDTPDIRKKKKAKSKHSAPKASL